MELGRCVQPKMAMRQTNTLQTLPVPALSDRLFQGNIKFRPARRASDLEVTFYSKIRAGMTYVDVCAHLVPIRRHRSKLVMGPFWEHIRRVIRFRFLSRLHLSIPVFVTVAPVSRWCGLYLAVTVTVW